MDMNWQAMLHEAADASFEKNIESLAAADNDACSYADLPKAKIQELSEIFCENWQNPVKQRITPHFLTTSPSNYYEFTTKE